MQNQKKKGKLSEKRKKGKFDQSEEKEDKENHGHQNAPNHTLLVESRRKWTKLNRKSSKRWPQTRENVDYIQRGDNQQDKRVVRGKHKSMTEKREDSVLNSKFSYI